MAGESEKSAEAMVAECYSTWATDYYEGFYGSKAAYPPVHAVLIRQLLQDASATSVLDAGCGPASFLRFIHDMEVDWHGFDLTPEMVVEARRVADALGRKGAFVWQGSVLDDGSFSPPGSDVDFDAGIMVGVLPHVEEGCDEEVLGRLRAAVRPGGLLIAEARNALFGLFTFNRPTYELITGTLMDWDALSVALESESHEAALQLQEGLRAMLRMDLPPVRLGTSGEPGYDEVLSRVHVPFELLDQAQRAGWQQAEVLFCHYHAVPPMFTPLAPGAAREYSLGMEDPRDWRGYFMASTVLLVGRA